MVQFLLCRPPPLHALRVGASSVRKHPEIAATVQEKLRSLGFQATNFVLTNDEAGDARLAAELKRAEYDGVAIGGYINGQDAVNFPATEETTVWFNRVLNIIHANAPGSKIILVRGPEDVVPAIERVLVRTRHLEGEAGKPVGLESPLRHHDENRKAS